MSWVSVWLILAIVVGGVGWRFLLNELDAEMQRQEVHALQESAMLARSYADDISRTVGLLDQILLHLKYEWRLSNGALSLDEVHKAGLLPADTVVNVLLVDGHGKILSAGLPAQANLAVGEHSPFLAHKTNTADFLDIAPPVADSASGKRQILLSRRLSNDSGSFKGVAVISVLPDYFTAGYDRATYGDHGLLALLGTDGQARAVRIGRQTDTPASAPRLTTARFPTPSGSALKDGSWFADGRGRYVGWSTLDDYPLIAVTGLDRSSALAHYAERRGMLLRQAAWATFDLGALTLIAIGFSLRLAWRKHQLTITQNTYRLATEGGNEGFYIVRPARGAHGDKVDFEFVDSNERGAEFLGRRRAELLAARVSSLDDSAQPAQLLRILRTALGAGFHETEIEVGLNGPIAHRWIYLRAVRVNANLAVTLRDISDAKAHVAELVRRSNEDVLTGLPNRHWVQAFLPDALARAAQANMALALLFIDLDGFKSINDTAGHAVGDDILRKVARRLKEAVRPHDYVARLGGDEFVVIIEGVEQQADVAHVAERALRAMRDNFRHGQHVYALSASIGISLFPADGADADTLLRNADVAMYSVKASGKSAFHFFDPRFYEALRDRLQRMADLRFAIEHDQFVMHYQQRVALETGATSSLESLVRWIHPVRGLLPPLEFIDLAEESGLILGLGELVIDKVCAQIARWERNGGTLVPVSINVSARQFREVDIAHLLATAMARHGIEPSLVEVEVTESSMMGEDACVLTALAALRRMGVKLLVDDFGTGYSSLSQLQRLDFDVLKVDRAFTVEIDRTEKGRVFVKAIITMAHALGLRVVAEGVEHATQVRILKHLKCDEIQGFFVSVPLPPAETQLASLPAPLRA